MTPIGEPQIARAIQAVSLITEAPARWASPALACCVRFSITTPQRLAAFLAQTAHESAGFGILEENLHYSAGRLCVVFGKYFGDMAIATAYAGQPERIASRVYAMRMGNGDEASGDGWRYRGRGLIQITGKDNYRDCGAALGLDLIGNPDLLLEDSNAMLSAGWFFVRANGNMLADDGHMVLLTQRINGGINGLDDRLKRWAAAKAALGIL